MTEDEIIKEALTRFDEADSATSEWRVNATKDLRFCTGQQWDEQAQRDRENVGRPCFTSDHISPAIRQIVNENRQNRPAIEVDPKGDGAEVETAKVMAGLIRDIEYQSNADAAYDTASEYSVKTGMGYFRVVAEYDNPDTFDQVLRIKSIADPMSVYLDPSHLEADGSDIEWGFIVKEIEKESYKRQYGSTELAKISSWTGRRVVNNGWVTRDTVRVAEYFYKDHTEEIIYHIARFLPNAAGELQFFKEDVVTEKPTDEEIESKATYIINKRTVDRVTVKWLVLNGSEVISTTEWPGKFIPIFPVKGEEVWVDGKRVIMGAVRRAQDMQRILNHMVSNQVEAIDLSNKVPYVGAVGQFDTFEEQWRTANQNNWSYLEYNPVDVDGRPAGAPQRQNVETPIGAISATRGQAIEDIKAIFGVYDRPEGAQGTESSGVAIMARREQTSNSSFAYYDNLVRAVKHLGRVLLECIPVYYDTQRTIRIVKPNGEQELVAINDMTKDKKVDFSMGLYDVVVKTGPTYATKRQRLVEQGTALVAQYPAAGPLIADLLVQSSDFEGADVIAARLRTQVPAEVLAATGEDGDIKGDPKQAIMGLQQQLQAAKKNLEALNQHAADTETALKQAQEELQLEKMRAKTDTDKAQMDYNIKAQQLALDESIAELDFLSKQQAFELQKEQLELNRQAVQVKAVQTASNLANDAHDRENAYLDKSRDMTIQTISDIKPLPQIEVGADTSPRIGGKFTG